MANIDSAYCGMYKMKPIYNNDAKIQVSAVMYPLKNLHDEEVDEKSESLAALEKRQESILKQLEDLQKSVKQLQTRYGCQNGPERKIEKDTISKEKLAPITTAHMKDIVKDIVVSANPEQPPLSLFVLYQLLKSHVSVFGSSYVHSSVSNVPDSHKDIFHNGIGCQRGDHSLAITVIWKNVEKGPVMMVNPQKQTAIYGEANIARYVARILNPNFDTEDIVQATEIDQWLDTATFQILRGNAKERAAAVRSLNSKLGRNDWLVGSTLSLADIVVWSALHQSGLANDTPANVKKWIMHCNLHELFNLAQKFL